MIHLHSKTRLFAGVCIPLLGAYWLSACSMKRNLDEMHSATMQMNGNTSQLTQTSDQMNQTTQQLAQLTREMYEMTENLKRVATATYLQLRQGDSLSIRREQIHAMETSKTLSKKIAEAGSYFMAFEFQLKTASDDKNAPKGDTPESRAVLYQKAAGEFFRTAKEYLRPDSATAPGSDDPDQMNLYALALAMHQINPNQEALAGEQNFKPVSMLSLVTHALSLRQPLQQGKAKLSDLPAYVTEVLNNDEEAIYLLQLRYNVFSSLVLPEIAPIEQGSGPVNSMKELILKLKMASQQWKPDFSRLNHVEIYSLSQFLKASLAMRGFMKSIGVKPMLDAKLEAIIKNAQIEPVSVDVENDAATKAHAVLVNEFLSLLRETGYPSDAS